jgi:hypothetical protein
MRAHTLPSEPFGDAPGREMKVVRTEFGSITIAGKTYEHDVVIRLSDKVIKRKK